MFRKTALLTAFLAFAACSSSTPRIIQATTGLSEIRLTVGMATQVEMPEESRVQSVTVGNPALVSAEQAGDVVNLIAKGGEGETNLIIRARDDDNRVKVYQYHLITQNR